MGIEKNVKNVEKKIQLYYCLLGLMAMMVPIAAVQPVHDTALHNHFAHHGKQTHF